MAKMEQSRGENNMSHEAAITDSIVGILGVENTVLFALVLKIIYAIYKQTKKNDTNQ